MHKIKKQLLLSVASFSLLSVAVAQESNSCNKTATEQASLYYSKTIELDGDPGSLYKQSIDEVNEVALKNEFKNYKMTSDGVSVSTSSYNGMLDVSVNISIEYDSNFKAITALSQGTKANSISSQRYFEPCE